LRNQQDSPLLRLPGELRNKIYEYAYGGMIIKAFTASTKDKHYPVYEQGNWTLLPFSTGDLLNSTMVCRQVYSEIGGIPILHNELWFSIKSMSTKLSKIATAKREKLTTIWIYVRNFKSMSQKPEPQIRHLQGLELVNVVKSSDSSWKMPGLDTLTHAVIGLKVGLNVTIHFE
jgi:hypothetical protein